MKRILPYEIPEGETYQSVGFLLGIVKSYQRVRNYYYNKYINVQCNRTLKIENVLINFTECFWGDMWQDGIAELDLYHFDTLNKKNFLKFLEERIEQENYILLYNVDEYYLSYTNMYKKKHNVHDTYIYGYDDDNFFISAYEGGKLRKLTARKKEIVECVYKTKSDKIKDFCTFRIHPAARVDIDLSTIKREMENYINGVSRVEDDTVNAYGSNVLLVIIECLNELSSKKKVENKIDLRPFRFIWEHKKIMFERVNALKKVCCMDDYICDMIQVVMEDTYRAFLIMQKYGASSTRSTDALTKVSAIYKDVLSKEKEIYTGIIELLSVH